MILPDPGQPAVLSNSRASGNIISNIIIIIMSINLIISISFIMIATITIRIIMRRRLWKKHSSGEEDPLNSKLEKSTKSGAGEQFLPLACVAKAYTQHFLFFV